MKDALHKVLNNICIQRAGMGPKSLLSEENKSGSASPVCNQRLDIS